MAEKVTIILNSDLDESVHSCCCGGPHQALNLGTAEVLGLGGQLGNVDIGREFVVLLHERGVYVEDLHAAVLVRETDLHLYLEAAGPQQRLVYHVLTVGHADHQDVVQLLDTVNLGQELVDHCVVHRSTARLQKHNITDMAVWSQLLERR